VVFDNMRQVFASEILTFPLRLVWRAIGEPSASSHFHHRFHYG
jgi:hypothetical protein